jgi:hypothetical protein
MKATKVPPAFARRRGQKTTVKNHTRTVWHLPALKREADALGMDVAYVPYDRASCWTQDLLKNSDIHRADAVQIGVTIFDPPDGRCAEIRDSRTPFGDAFTSAIG